MYNIEDVVSGALSLGHWPPSRSLTVSESKTLPCQAGEDKKGHGRPLPTFQEVEGS